MDTSKQESFDLLIFGNTFKNKIFDKASKLLPKKIIKGILILIFHRYFLNTDYFYLNSFNL